jgi:hypothetical protein
MFAFNAAAIPARNRGIRQAGSSRHRNLANQLGKCPRALRILRALAMHDVLELRMPRHGGSLDVGDCDEEARRGLRPSTPQRAEPFEPMT